MSERLLTIEKVASFLQVSPSSVYRWIKAGKLPAIKLGHRQVRVRQTDLEAYIRSHLTTPAQMEEEGQWEQKSE